MAKKADGIIEAVRYKNGQVVAARVYERRGAAYSDRLMLDRRELLEKLKNGKQFVIGERKRFLAGTFEEGKPVRVIRRDGKEFLSTKEQAEQAEQDELEGAPVF